MGSAAENLGTVAGGSARQPGSVVLKLLSLLGLI
jgi:hypothetical protein